jgi:hypothetical protein
LKVTNRQNQALQTSMTLPEFGKAMSALDLSSIPADKRKAALMDHLAKIMIQKIHDRTTAADLSAAYLMRRRNG